MKIFNAEQIGRCDHFTIQEQNICSVDLMEKSANACFEWLVNRYSQEYTYYIFCGKGNNGGDGLALARILLANNYRVEVFILQSQSEFSKETQINFDKFPTSVTFLEDDNFSVPKEKSIIIDAFFGIGLNRKLEEKVARIITKLNTIDAVKISIDIPSGLYADKLPDKLDTVVFKAEYTLSLGFYKRNFFHPESAMYAGVVQLLDIELSKQFIDKEVSQNYVIAKQEVNNDVKVRSAFSHKGDYGKAILIGGSYGKIGAVTLAAQAALRTGAGIVYVLAPDCGYTILQTSAPEAMFISGGDRHINRIELPSQDVTTGIGIGLGTDVTTKQSLEIFLKKCTNPLVLDADALNIISENKNLLKLIPENSIITPHPKEFSRLFGATDSTLAQCELARKQAEKHKINIVLKGHKTVVLTPQGKCYYNIAGNAGMAKGGSGDVLTGIITSLLTQGYTPKQAAILGVNIHGRAGDFAAEKYSQEAMTAQNIIECLSDVFKEINKNK